MRTPLVRLHAGVSLPRLIITIPLCDEPTVSARCTCGGVLAFVAGRFQHVEACLECHDSKEPCPAPDQHQSCFRPEPVVCAHPSCRDLASVEIPCTERMNRDDDAVDDRAPTCCGCCWDLGDQLAGRALWPAEQTFPHPEH